MPENGDAHSVTARLKTCRLEHHSGADRKQAVPENGDAHSVTARLKTCKIETPQRRGQKAGYA
jgi:hypothetical protein